MASLFFKSESNQSVNQPNREKAQSRDYGNLEVVDDEQRESQSSDRGDGLISLAYVSSRGFFFQ